VCSCFDVCWSFGVAGWGGIRVEGFSLPHGYHPNQILTSSWSLILQQIHLSSGKKI